MDSTKAFDAYEVIGVITPGAVVAMLLTQQWPEFRALLGSEGLSVGGLGFFVIAAFVLGHLTQALGNLVDGLVWAIPGIPTAWVRSPTQTLISPSQRDQIQAKVAVMEPNASDISKIDRRSWRSISGRMFARVNAAGRSGRIDVCNRTYGLSRGLAAAFLAAAAWLAFDAQALTTEALVAAALAAAAILRMRRAGIHYARSLFLEFVDLP
jgi:hypothetical protein